MAVSLSADIKNAIKITPSSVRSDYEITTTTDDSETSIFIKFQPGVSTINLKKIILKGKTGSSLPGNFVI